jgi:hypothetical protein
MLPLGTLGPVPGSGKPRKTRLTQDEQRTLMTLWAISRSPLFIGANLTELDDETAALLTNRDLIAINQHGHGQRQVSRTGDLIVWTTKTDDREYLALFNVGDQPLTFQGPLSQYGFSDKAYQVHDVWRGTVALTKSPGGEIPPHGTALLELWR